MAHVVLRALAWSLARTYEAVLRCEAANQDPGNRRLAAARVFCRQPFIMADAERSLAVPAYGEDRSVLSSDDATSRPGHVPACSAS